MIPQREIAESNPPQDAPPLSSTLSDISDSSSYFNTRDQRTRLDSQRLADEAKVGNLTIDENRSPSDDDEKPSLPDQDSERNKSGSNTDSLGQKPDTGDQIIRPRFSPESNRDGIQRQIMGDELYQAYETLLDGAAAFDQMDGDGDGFVSATELTNYIDNLSQRETLSPEEQRKLRAARYMSENLSDLQNRSNDEWGPENSGITRRDLEENFTQRAWAARDEIMRRLDARIVNGAPGSTKVSGDMTTTYDESAGVFAANYNQLLFPFFSLMVFDHSRRTTLSFTTGTALLLRPQELEIKRR